jgi:hypothetical protein
MIPTYQEKKEEQTDLTTVMDTDATVLETEIVEQKNSDFANTHQNYTVKVFKFGSGSIVATVLGIAVFTVAILFFGLAILLFFAVPILIFAITSLFAKKRYK